MMHKGAKWLWYLSLQIHFSLPYMILCMHSISCTNPPPWRQFNVVIKAREQRFKKDSSDSDKCCRTHTLIHAMILPPEQDSLVTPGAAWPKFRAPFCVTGGRQAHWAQHEEQGRAVHEIVHSYIYSKEVTSSNLHHQLISYEGQHVLCGVFNGSRVTLVFIYFIILDGCVW